MKTVTPEYKTEYYPVDKSRWKDLEKLFGENGACGGCWCMTWRLLSKEFNNNKGEENKRLIKEVILKNERPGIIAYINNEPAGWCAVAPREVYIRLKKSKILSPVDDKKVWSISCIFIRKQFRRKGLSSELIRQAVKFCGEQGAKIVEGYPVEPYSKNIPAAFVWTGLPSCFEAAGFEEILRRSRTRPIMRYYIK
jgi:GNAT superfamily N-acetyltransferase